LTIDELRVGDVVEIWITGCTRRFVALVEQTEPPRLTVPEWPMPLKMGDFILLGPAPDAAVLDAFDLREEPRAKS
jgi:hypothetical protein